MRCHIAEYESVFRNRTKRFFDNANKYTEGIIRSEMRNIGRISEDTGVDYYQMQHFITESHWDARELIDKVAGRVSSDSAEKKDDRTDNRRKRLGKERGQKCWSRSSILRQCGEGI